LPFLEEVQFEIYYDNEKMTILSCSRSGRYIGPIIITEQKYIREYDVRRLIKSSSSIKTEYGTYQVSNGVLLKDNKDENTR